MGAGVSAGARTRSEYMANLISHQEYYGQFVNDAVKGVVARTIGVDVIRASRDPHFNDIALRRWDAITDSVRHAIDATAWKHAQDTYSDRTKFYWSLSDSVCIAKAAARIIQDEGTAGNEGSA